MPGLSPSETKNAIAYNDKREFRLDWVRKLQSTFLNTVTIEDGSFNKSLVAAVAEFQANHGLFADGKIGRSTRPAIEKAYPALQTTVLGENLTPRVLVPTSASLDERYHYYRQVIGDLGSVFRTNVGEINLLAIRGVEIADESAEHAIDGEALPPGQIYQTNSSRDYAKAIANNTTDDHMRGGAFNDLIASIWRDNEGHPRVQERRGSVDPSGAWAVGTIAGTAHLRDGQYAYKLGTHSTSATKHKAAVLALALHDPDNLLNAHTLGNGRVRYNALNQARAVEVWRDQISENDLHISPAEVALSNDRIWRHDPRYIGYRSINIHTASDERVSSVGCQNIRASDFMHFMREISNSTSQDWILYTLADASKIDLSLV